MIGVLEAKDERHSPDAGLEQAKSYARLLDVPFAYSSNGHAFVEFDFFENKSRELDPFHAPDELWKRWWAARTGGTDFFAEVVAEERLEYRMDPLLHPFCPPSRSGKELRYFQEVAVRRVIERALRGQRRILLTTATGTGKTFTAFQIVWKRKKSGWLRKPVLFIADRNVLRDQAYNAFSPFVEGQSDPSAVIEEASRRTGP
jgi:type I restriction enzyme R subunit